MLIGEGEFYVTAVANIDANCLLKRQVTLFRNGAVIGSGNTKHYGNVTIIVGPPPPPGRYVVKMPRKDAAREKSHGDLRGGRIEGRHRFLTAEDSMKRGRSWQTPAALYS